MHVQHDHDATGILGFGACSNCLHLKNQFEHALNMHRHAQTLIPVLFNEPVPALITHIT